MNIVAMCIFIRDKKVLIEKRKENEDNYAGVWTFPGGHKEKKDKDVEETLKREMKEELAVDVKNYEFVGVFEDIDPTSKEPYAHHVFLCYSWKGKIKETREEEKIKWVKIRKLKNIKGISQHALDVIEEVKKEL